MLAKLRARLTYANVVATLALFVALGGSSYAAIQVTGKNVKNSSLTGKDVKNNSLTGKDVKGIKSGDVTDRSLLAKDFKAGQLPAGPQGLKGDKGNTGGTGTQGPKGDPGNTGGTGTQGPKGDPGPVAGKFVMDIPATAPVGATGTVFGQVGPWEFKGYCFANALVKIVLSARGPGEYQIFGMTEDNDVTTFDHMSFKGTGGGLDPNQENIIRNEDAPTDGYKRIADTFQLKSGSTVATVTYNVLADARGSTHTCHGYGTGVLAG